MVFRCVMWGGVMAFKCVIGWCGGLWMCHVGWGCLSVSCDL